MTEPAHPAIAPDGAPDGAPEVGVEPPAKTFAGRADQLLRLLDVGAVGDGTYRGARQPGGRGRVFGGQVIAQGLVAAMRETEPARHLHSLHCYFMRAGNEDLPIDYTVNRDFDGGSFSTRRILAAQAGRPILTMTASFHRMEAGFAHQEPMPNVPEPEALLSESERIAQESDPATAKFLTRFQHSRPIEIRSVERRTLRNPVPQSPTAHLWLRLGARLEDLPHAPVLAAAMGLQGGLEAGLEAGNMMPLHRAILAYASDMMLLGTCVLPHGINGTVPGVTMASLDHAVWFHDDFRADDWLLYATDSPWAGRARGFNRGRFYTRDGRLVASVAQEGLIRFRPPESDGAG